MPTERFQFTGEGGHQLAAALDTPDGPVQAYALFAHCFTCGKDVLAAKRIATALAAKGIAVLRFDFTGLGASEGEFANSTFSSNVADLVRAADHLRETRGAPAILIGHSLGGAAILAAAGQIPDAKAVVTIAAPSDPVHVTHLFRDRIEDIRKHGEVEVQLAGRPFHIKRAFLDDIAEHSLMSHVAKLHKALLIMHSPTDDTVGIDNATNIFVAAKHPKSFVSLAGSDHLLSGKRDAAYVAGVIAAWVERYVEPVAAQPAAAASEAPRNVVVRETRNSKFQQTVTTGPHQMLADEPVAAGGQDSGPGPYDFVLAGLGRLHLDDDADVCRPQIAAARAHHGDAEAQQDSRGRLRGMRNAGGHAGPDRSCDFDRGRPRRRSAQALDGNRRQVPGAPDAHLGNPDRDEGGGLSRRQRADTQCAAQA